MDMNEFAKLCSRTAIFHEHFPAFLEELGVPKSVVDQMDPAVYMPRLAVLYLALGAAEMIEALGSVKKWLRGDKPFEEVVANVVKEQMDGMWYIGASHSVFGLDMNETAKALITKLEQRRVTGTLHGDGEDVMVRKFGILLRKLSQQPQIFYRDTTELEKDVLNGMVERGLATRGLNGWMLTPMGRKEAERAFSGESQTPARHDDHADG